MASHADRDWALARSAGLAKVAQSKEGLGSPLQFRVLHVLAVILILPVVGATRLRPGHWREHRDESIFAETNRTVLTALGTALML